MYTVKREHTQEQAFTLAEHEGVAENIPLAGNGGGRMSRAELMKQLPPEQNRQLIEFIKAALTGTAEDLRQTVSRMTPDTAAALLEVLTATDP